ncbi:tRNA1(Val) (adenine(37)-N6)-methyltransferase [Nitratireductor pacificus]|uniref:Methyltransferase small n=1 Tax=Nitratireductor pacificus pht-3B TaxID=391937 RepID=K2MGT3_9HYPH|nr:methyltransferase [Nitratireductor pacificus]EKF19915.1 methyltransferase small [Nitratireductor pacificus pht-3B]
MADPDADDRFSVDSFHRDAFRLVQPVRNGHRAGIDAMLLAAALPDGFSGTVADLGAGAGAAGFAVAARCPGVRVTLVEQAATMADCARRSIALPHNADLGQRLTVLEADVTLSGTQRGAAGLPSNAFDAAIMNPPFNKASDRATPDALKRAAHVMPDDLFERWIRTAAAIVRPGGLLALIARPASLAPILAALERRFGGALVMPVHPDAERAAIRILLRARKGSRAGLALAPPLILHEADGAVTARADALTNGRATLFAD